MAYRDALRLYCSQHDHMRIHDMIQALDRARIRHASSVNSVLTFNCELDRLPVLFLPLTTYPA